MASSGSGVSNTSDPMAFTSDDEMATDSGVFTSDYTSTDEDDFQPFALPDFGDDMPLADGPPGEDLPLVPIPAPLPLAAVPFEEQPLDVLPDDDVVLPIEGPPEGDQDGGAPVEDGVPFVDVPVVDPVAPMIELPDMEVHSDSSASDSDESVASSYPPLGFGNFPRINYDEDTDMEDELVPEEQPAEAPVLPDDQDPAMPVPVIPEPVLAHDPIPEDAPAVAPPVTDAPTIVPSSAEIPVIAPIPDPIFDDLAPLATHIDQRYADTQNGWLEEDDYPPYVTPVTPLTAPVTAPPGPPPTHPHTSGTPLFRPHPTDIQPIDHQITFLQDIPPPQPGEGSSRQPPSHTPFATSDSQPMPQFPYPGFDPSMSSTAPFMSYFSHTTLPFPSTPHTTQPVSAPMGEPFLWSSPQDMLPTGPHHPYHVGPSTEDILVSFMMQQEALTRRMLELERSYRAMEEDWLLMRSLLFSHFPPPPPPPSA